MNRSIVFIFAIAIVTTGCLRSTVVVKRSTEGRLSVTHTILYARDQANLLAATGAMEVATVDSLMNGTVNVMGLIDKTPYARDSAFSIQKLENVTTPDAAGFRVTASVASVSEYRPTMLELLNLRSRPDTAVAHFTDSAGALRATLHPRSFIRDFSAEDDAELSDEDAHRLVSSIDPCHGTVIDMIIEEDTILDTLIHLDLALMSEILCMNDDIARAFLTLNRRSDQEIVDFLASFRYAGLRVRQFDQQALHPKIFIADIPTPEKRRAAFVRRLQFNTSSFKYQTVLAPWLATRMTLLERGVYEQLPWGRSMDSLMSAIREMSAEVVIKDITGGGRVIAIKNVKDTNVRYELIERTDSGLVEATEITLNVDDPVSRIEAARTRCLKALRAAGLEGQLITSTPIEFRARYRDKQEVLMEQYVVVSREATNEHNVPYTLRIGKKVVQQ